MHTPDPQTGADARIRAFRDRLTHLETLTLEDFWAWLADPSRPLPLSADPPGRLSR